jgi:hypothetical protein
MYKVPESFEAACNVTGTDPKFLPNIEGLSDITAKRHIADYKLEILHKATVGKWKADFANASQWKYTPWLKFSPSLGAFVCSNTYFTITYTCLGARFWFPEYETAAEFGSKYIDLINDLHRIA